MRRCDLATGAGRIRHALEHLETVCNEISDQWDDSVSKRFAEQHLEAMIPGLKLGLDAISREIASRPNFNRGIIASRCCSAKRLLTESSHWSDISLQTVSKCSSA